MPHLRRTILSVLAAVATALSASPALAADSGYQSAAANWSFGSQPGSVGGYLSCPTGTKAVSSGAASSVRLGYLQSGTSPAGWPPSGQHRSVKAGPRAAPGP